MLMLQEPVAIGQRVSSFRVEAEQTGEWVTLAQGTTIGYRRILSFPAVTAGRIRILITGARACPAIANVELYRRYGAN